MVGEALGVDEESVIEAFGRLRENGRQPRRRRVPAGASARARSPPWRCPPERLEAVAAIVSSFPEVNHNYEREHRLNLWFVVAAADDEALVTTLARIDRLTGIAVLRLPLVEEFHIDLGFDLEAPTRRTPRASKIRQRRARRHRPAAHRCARRRAPAGAAALRCPRRVRGARRAARDRPARALGGRRPDPPDRRGRAPSRAWLRANAMVVWDVPDETVARFGRQLAAAEGITLCYRRARRRPVWPYNLYCMIHGTERRQVAARIEALNRDLGLAAFPHAVLFSRTRFKQTGARYSAKREATHG